MTGRRPPEAPTRGHLRRSDAGGALLETPFVLIVVGLLAMGIVTVVQAVYVHHQLATGVRAGARYAAKADYDPAADPPSSSRRRTEEQVRSYVADASGSADLDPDPLTCGSRCVRVTVTPAASMAAAERGDEVVVRAETVVDNALYQAAASLTNTFTGLLGGGDVFDPDGIPISAEALAVFE